MRRNNFLVFLIILSMFVITACMNSKNSSVPNAINEGNLAPNFSLFDKEGNMVTLKQFAGKKVYIKFWASWCPTCLTSLKEIDSLASDENDFEILTVVSPRHEGEMKKEDFITWFESLGYDNMIVLFDENGLWSREFNVLAYPTSYYIGTDGVLVKSIVGNHSNDKIVNEMKKVF